MGTSQTITTGVDRLVQLVKEKKKISIDEAAKKLSVPKVLVEEWADFLEEKDIVGVEYKFAVAYLVYKELGRQELKQKTRALSDKKEGFERRINSVMDYLEHESGGIPKLKKEFEKLSRDIDSKAKHAKKELELLGKYDEMKKAVETQILEQEKQFEAQKEIMASQMEKNKRLVSRYLQMIDEKGAELVKEEQVAGILRKDELALEKKLVDIARKAGDYEKKIETDESMVDATLKKILEIKKASEGAREQVEIQKKSLQKLIETSRQHDQKIEETKQKFLKKVSVQDNKSISDSELKSMTLQFRTVYAKKIDAEKLAGRLEADIKYLKVELKSLASEANIIGLHTSGRSLNYEKEFNEKFRKLESKKDSIRKETSRLVQMLKGL